MLVEEHDRPHEDVDAVGIFNNFHTSSSTGLSDAAREAVVSVAELPNLMPAQEYLSSIRH